jgi:hypothetical protein
MSGAPPPRDWDKEMAEIDRIIAKQPTPVAPRGEVAPSRSAGASPGVRPAAAVPAVRGHTRFTAWIRVLLGLTVAVGVAFAWPYSHGCGLPLYGYLAAAGGVAVAGLWAAVATWRRRLGVAHVLALLVIGCGAFLIVKTVLDRTGYPSHPATWSCP